LSGKHYNRAETGWFPSRTEYNPARGEMPNEKPSKTAAELEASIKVEMEDICDCPTDMTISVQPDGGSWKEYFCKKDQATTPIGAKWSSRSLAAQSPI
jgi:hypothetical protein